MHLEILISKSLLGKTDLRMYDLKVFVCVVMEVTTKLLLAVNIRNLRPCHADCVFTSSIQLNIVVILTKMGKQDHLPVLAPPVAHPTGPLVDRVIND